MFSFLKKDDSNASLNESKENEENMPEQFDQLSKEVEALKNQLSEALENQRISSPSTSQNTNTGIVNAVSEVKLTQFYETDPELWFVIVESHFEARKISSNKSKYLHTVANLSSKVALQVKDLLMSQFTDDKYEKLKRELISIFSESATTKFEKLISNEPLGDMKPSQALHKMKSFASSGVGEDFIKNLWMKKLPSTTRTVLAAPKDKLDDLAVLADRMWEVSDRAVISSVTEKSSLEKTLGTIQQQLERITNRLNAIESRGRQTQRDTTPHRQRSQSRSTNRGEKNEDKVHAGITEKWASKQRSVANPARLKQTQKTNMYGIGTGSNTKYIFQTPVYP